MYMSFLTILKAHTQFNHEFQKQWFFGTNGNAEALKLRKFSARAYLSGVV